MKTKPIISALTILVFAFLWSCEKVIIPNESSEESLEQRAKGGKGKPDDGPLGIEFQDLGTLGGPTSRANAVNIIDGIVYVVGNSRLTNDNRHAFLWTVTAGMVDLGYLHEEYPFSDAHDINASGTIVGYSSSLVPPFYSSEAVTWSAFDPGSGPISVNPANSVNSSVAAINTLSDMAGSRVDTCGYEGYVDCGSGSPGDSISIWSAFMWKSNGSYVDLGTFGRHSRAFGINDNLIVVGYSEDPFGEDRAFVWQNGNFNLIPGLENLWSWAHDVNNAGQIVGEFDTLNGDWSNVIRGFISERNEYGEWQTTKLPTLGTRTIAYAISESGYITGTTYVGKNGRTTASDGVPFLYREDIGMYNLGTNDKGRSGSSFGYDIIEQTDDIIIVVGIRDTQEGQHATMWTIDLCALIPGRC